MDLEAAAGDAGPPICISDTVSLRQGDGEEELDLEAAAGDAGQQYEEPVTSQPQAFAMPPPPAAGTGNQTGPPPPLQSSNPNNPFARAAAAEPATVGG